MLHILVTLMFVGAGMFSLALIGAMLVDNSARITLALRIRSPLLQPVTPFTSRVRVVCSPRFVAMAPATLRAAA